jgi:hypothetical protein
MELIMKSQTLKAILSICMVFTLLSAPKAAQAQSEVSALSALSALPIASVVVGAAAVAGSVVAVPVVLSTTGAVLVIKTVESTARGTVYILERASDGARVSVEITGKSLVGSAQIIGTSVVVTVVGAGVLLSAAGEVIAFLPNALGKALLHNERTTGY